MYATFGFNVKICLISPKSQTGLIIILAEVQIVTGFEINSVIIDDPNSG